ncbi:MAG: PhnD/SsuA/transferrin family substrate-binding protein [bacterium]
MRGAAGQSVNGDDRAGSGRYATSHLKSWPLLIALLVAGSAGGVVLVVQLSNAMGWGGIAQKYRNSPRIALSPPRQPQDSAPARVRPPPQPPVRFVVAPVISPEEALYPYRALTDYLSQALERRTTLIPKGSHAEVSSMLRHSECEIALVSTYAYVEGHKDFGLQAIAMPVAEGKTDQYAYLVTPRGTPAKSLLDLRGKRFVSADVLSSTGWLYPIHWLLQRGEDHRHFFSEHLIAGSHDAALEALTNGTADGASVDSFVYHQMLTKKPSTAQRVRVISKSPPLGMPPIVVHPRLDPALKARITSALLTAHQHPAGRKALWRLGYDRFVRPIPGRYDSVRQMARAVENHR